MLTNLHVCSLLSWRYPQQAYNLLPLCEVCGDHTYFGARLQMSTSVLCAVASHNTILSHTGTITVTQQDDVTPFTVTALGIRVGTIELLPSDDYPSGIRACTSTSFCLDIFSPEPGTLDFVAHADVRAEAGGLLSMSSLEEWYSVLIDGPPTVSQALEALGANLGDAEPLAALGGGKGAQQEQTYIASRRLLLKGTQLQRLGRPTVLGWED